MLIIGCVDKYARLANKRYGQVNPFLKYFTRFMRRRIDSFIRARIWQRFRSKAWRMLCKRVETLYSLGVKRLNALGINIALVRNRTISARTIGVYAVRKLIARNRIGPIFKPLIKNLASLFTGMKFSCKGRFNRRQRASLTVFSKGSIKLSTFTSDIDYSYAHIPLKYGVGCIKIWINRGFRDKHRIHNSYKYQAYYKPRKSRALNLTAEEKAKFKFVPTAKLLEMSRKLKRELLLSNKTSITKPLRHARKNTLYKHKLFGITTKLAYLYKYARWRSTASYKYIKTVMRRRFKHRTNLGYNFRKLILRKYAYTFDDKKKRADNHKRIDRLLRLYKRYNRIKHRLLAQPYDVIIPYKKEYIVLNLLTRFVRMRIHNYNATIPKS